MRRHWRRSVEKYTTIQQVFVLVPYITRGLSFSVGFIIVLLLVSCAASHQAYNPNKKYSPKQLQQDFTVAWKTWQQNHPSLYWYNAKETVDNAFNELDASLNDSLTETEFRNKLAVAAETIKCGHTSVRMSKAFGKYNSQIRNDSAFPLAIKTWGGDSLIVVRNAFRKDSQLVRGTIITTINGKPASQIISEMSRLISGDGFNNNFKYQVISNSFPTYFRYAFGLSKHYEIEYIDQNGISKSALLYNYNPRADTLDKKVIKVQQQQPKPTKAELRQARLLSNRRLTIDSANQLGYMLLNTFSKNHLNRFFRKSFKTLQQQQVPNLVIELRENGGGNVNKSTRLTRYITDHPFRVADSALAISFKYPYPQYVEHGFWYKVGHWFVSPRRQSDGFFHFKQIRKKYQPFKRNHYNGQVYIITGGYTFSASTLFIHPVKGQKNVTIVGEETGGGAYGNTALNIPDVVLPNTGIRVRLPLYRVVVDKDIPHNGRGILPDVFVPPASNFLRSNTDPKMEKIKELIKAAKSS